MKYRAILQKCSKVRFISHLDLMRLCMRALKKSGIPVAYSEGFTPHPLISFITALPLGQESLCEPFDINLSEDFDPKTIKNKLNEVLPCGVKISKVYEPVNKAGDLAEALYKIILYKSDPASNATDTINQWYGRESILIEKKNKKGILRQIDIKDKIILENIEENGEEVDITARLACGSKANLNPDVMIKSIFSFNNIFKPPARVTKLKIFAENGKEFC